MKRVLLAALLFASTSLALAAGSLRVVTTTEDLASISREIAGNRADIIPTSWRQNLPIFWGSGARIS
jgi:ABC-type Zn uptake system ZnuABC Zn-binding protein ZnuA